MAKSIFDLYDDGRLTLLVPKSVRVKSPSPNFLATGRGGLPVLAIAVDPGVAVERTWLELLATPYHDPLGQARVVHEATFAADRGRERVVELTNPIGQIVLVWMGALYLNGTFVQLQLSASGDLAANVVPWRECIDSIALKTP